MCRTRVMGNVNGPEISGSRGNFHDDQSSDDCTHGEGEIPGR